MLIKIPKGWEIPERDATPESTYMNRRQLLAAAGFLSAGTLLQGATSGSGLYPAKRNDKFTLDRPVTPEAAAEGYNNFYEFTMDKEAVKDKVGNFQTSPWTIEVTGLCNKPTKYDMDSLVKIAPLEERLYRHRCVETWAMAVPWTGFELADLIKAADPKPEAKFVKFTSVKRGKNEMPGISEQPWYPWPYTEGLRMDEAMNPLAFVVTGLYGKPIAKQNGAPVRIAVPWKYGYKSAKSIVKIEFVKSQPPTLWNQLASNEYGFYSNVNPGKPHPRWSQAYEKVIPNMDRRPTQLYNGYGDYVAKLYNGKED